MAETLDTGSDYVIDFKGNEAWRCALCGDFADTNFPHRECCDREKFWDDFVSEQNAAREYADELEAWAYLEEVW